jgi:hypothetical protein
LDNQRKPVARLYLRDEKKIIEVHDDDANQRCQHDYNGIKDVFPCVQTMMEVIEIYDGKRQARPEQMSETDSENGEETPKHLGHEQH